jgi:hypothetical protein
MEDSSGYSLNPAFGFNTFGYAPPGLTPANPTFGFQQGMPTFGQAYGHVTSPPAVTPNTVAPPNFSFAMPAPQPDKPTTIEQAIHAYDIDPHMSVINPQPTPFSPPETPQIDPNMQAPKSVPTPPMVMPIAYDPTIQDEPMPNLSKPDPLAIDPQMPQVQSVPEADPFAAPTPAVAFNNALLGMLANQAVVQDAMQNLSLAPPEGYEQAFNAPMSMSEALNATLSAMNPSMTAPSEESDTSTSPGAPSGEDGGDGDGGQGGGPGATGQGGGPGGSPGSGGVSGPGMGGIGSEGGGGGPGGGDGE